MSTFRVAACMALAACGSGRRDEAPAAGIATAVTPVPPSGSVDAAAVATAPAGWSAVESGLRIRLAVPTPVTLAPPPAQRGSQPVTLQLHVENTTDHTIRIKLVRPEIFRLFSSTLRVWAGGKVVSLQPEPHPHGYLMTEADFIAIVAHGSTSYGQTLYLSDTLAQPGAFEVEWMFENATTRWPGGETTLDGPTTPLFGGTDVPDLWTGKLSTRAPLVVER